MKGIAIPLDEVLSRLGRGEDEPTASRPIPEAQVMTLRENAEIYARCRHPSTFPFQVGDLVTPRRATMMYDQGVPHIVVETNPTASPQFEGETHFGTTSWGCRPNMRVAVLTPDGKAVSLFWVEAFFFEPYRGPVPD